MAAKPEYGKREVGAALIGMGGAVAGVGIVGLSVLLAIVGAALAGMGVIARRHALRAEEVLSAVERTARRADLDNGLKAIQAEYRELLRNVLREQGLPHADKDVDDLAALLKRLPE